MKKTIISLNHQEAKQFFLKNESYCNIDLPPYLNFSILLNELSNKLNNRNINEFKKLLFQSEQNQAGNGKFQPSDFENVNYRLLHNKNGKFDWRPFELINPMLYISLVHKMTELENWEKIITRFLKIRDRSCVECISIPNVSENKNSDIKEQVINWWEGIEQQSLKLSLDFRYIHHTDITDCYGSIYTHSIPWAIHSKKVSKSKRNRKNNSLIGNSIDTHIQAMSYGQTNGIPQGSVLTDFIAEIVLNYSDLLLSQKLNNIDVREFKILRYRDDYRIFTNNPTLAESIIKHLTEVLISLGLKLHPQKTTSSDNIIYSSIKEDKLDWLLLKDNSSNSIQKQLLVVHDFSNKYPNSGTLTKQLKEISSNISKKSQFNILKILKSFIYTVAQCVLCLKDFDYHYKRCIKPIVSKRKNFNKNENIEVLISIIVDIAYYNPRTYSISNTILSKLFNLIEDEEEAIKIITKVIEKFKFIPNTGHMQIWLQRAIIKTKYTDLEFCEKICKLVNGDNIALWNNDWLDEEIINIFNQNSILDEGLLSRISPIIKDDEVLMFNELYG
jgi:hypothetical protein